MQTVAVIDYGMGNLHSVAKALEHVGAGKVLITSDAAVIREADRIVFPGVGAIRDCMAEIKRLGFDDLVREVSRDQVGLVPGDWPVHSFALPPSAHQQFLELSVSDTGIGIAPDDMGKLFKAFSQIDSSLARKFEGTGLGLAMVKQLTDLHGGSVAVASRADLGARFVVWLPLHRATEAADTWPKS